VILTLGGGGSPVKPLSGNAISSSATDLHGINGVVLNESLMELAANGMSVSVCLVRNYITLLFSDLF